jgi:O-antigen/teichoic acid export membrane protein
MKEKFITANLYYFSSQIIVLILSVARGFVVPKLLLPAEYGLLAIMGLVMTYARSSHLGVLNVFDREYPKKIVNGKTPETENFKNTCFAMMITTVAIYSMGTLIYFFLNYYSRGKMVFALMFFFAVSLVFDSVNEFNIISFKTRGKFAILSLNRIIAQAGLVLPTILLTYLYGFTGALIAIVLINIAINYFYFINTDRPRFQINTKLACKILPTAIHIYFSVILSIVLMTMDKVFVSRTLPHEQFGIYNFGYAISNMALIVSSSISYVIFPFMMQKFGENNNVEELLPHFEKPIYALTWLLPIFFSLLFVFCTFFIPWYLPKYRQVMDFLPYLLLSIFFFSVSQIPDTFLIGINKQNILIRNQLMIIAVATTGLAYIFVRHNQVIFIARWSAIYMFVYALLSFISSAGYLYQRNMQILKHLLFYLFPSLCLILITWLVYNAKYFAPHLFRDSPIVNMIFQMTMIALSSLPFIIYLDRKLNFLSDIPKIISQKIRG